MTEEPSTTKLDALLSKLSELTEYVDWESIDTEEILVNYLSDDNLEQLDDIVTLVKGVRDGLDESSMTQNLKVQLVLDLLEIIIKLYDGESIETIRGEFLDIFKPANYFHILTKKMEERLREYNEAKIGDEPLDE